MGRRKNGSGTLYRRGEVWYAQIKAGGRTLRLSTGETNKRRALARLDTLAKGYDLSDEERLAAISAALRPRRRAVGLADAFGEYANAPRNALQPAGAREKDGARWRAFLAWLHGAPAKGKRKRILPAHPEAKTLDDITDAIAAQFVAEMRKKTAPATVNAYVRVCRRIWTLLDVSPNPWEQFPKIAARGHLRKAFSDEEIRRIIDAAQGELKTLFTVGIYTGLRLGDAATLRWEQFTEDMGILLLRPRKTAESSGRVVAIPVHAALKAALGERQAEGYAMPNLAAMHPAARSAMVQKHLKDCGFETTVAIAGYRRKVADVGFHSLRSTFVTRLADGGMPLAQIQSLVGHVSPEMTQHYYRADAEAARGMLDRLPSFV